MRGASALFLLVIPAASAWAASGTTVLLLHEKGEVVGTDLERLQNHLRRLQRYASSKLRPISRWELLTLRRNKRAGDALRTARRRAQEGWLLAGHLRLEQADQTLRRALDDYAMAQTDEAACREGAIAVADLAFVHWQQKKHASAATLLYAARHLSTDKRLDPTRYPPPFVAFAGNLPGQTASSAMIESRPSGATIWQNCRRVGETPTKVRGGWSLLRLDAPGHRPWTAAAVAASSTEAALKQDAFLSPPSSADLAEVLALTNASGVVLWRGDQDGALVFRQLGVASSEQRLAAPAVPKPRPVLRREARPKAKSSLWLFRWIALGNAAGALAVGTTFGIIAAGSKGRLEEAVSSGATYNADLAADEDDLSRFGAAAYGLWIGGAVLAATAAVLWFLDEEPSTAAAASVGVGPGQLNAGWRW